MLVLRATSSSVGRGASSSSSATLLSSGSRPAAVSAGEKRVPSLLKSTVKNQKNNPPHLFTLFLQIIIPENPQNQHRKEAAGRWKSPIAALPILQPQLRHSQSQTRRTALPNKPRNPALGALPRPRHADAQCPVSPHLKQTSEHRLTDPPPPPNRSAFFSHFCFRTCEAGPSAVTFIILFKKKKKSLFYYILLRPGAGILPKCCINTPSFKNKGNLCHLPEMILKDFTQNINLGGDIKKIPSFCYRAEAEKAEKSGSREPSRSAMPSQSWG